MAQLAAWIPLVYLDELFALPSQLIFQHVREQIPAIVGYGFAKAELATLFPLGHRFDTKILLFKIILQIYISQKVYMTDLPVLPGFFFI